ncbi:hypothetical protein ACFPIF_04825 [Brevundimonas faecalis]|uniref:hypothetical protein n=1 Tax=Brevundimonas faecalis TaxID=947378 RepID=UPI003610F4BF
MRLLSIAAVGLFSLAGCSPSSAESASTDATEASQPSALTTSQDVKPKAKSAAGAPDALFERAEPAKASLALNREGSVWRVSLRAGGVPNGAATAADCELQAVGPQDADGVIAARVVPFEGELNDITAADIGANPPVIQVRVGPEGLFVEDGGAAGRFCGMGSDIDGFYRRLGSAD